MGKSNRGERSEQQPEDSVVKQTLPKTEIRFFNDHRFDFTEENLYQEKVGDIGVITAPVIWYLE